MSDSCASLGAWIWWHMDDMLHALWSFGSASKVNLRLTQIWSNNWKLGHDHRWYATHAARQLWDAMMVTQWACHLINSSDLSPVHTLDLRLITPWPIEGTFSSQVGGALGVRLVAEWSACFITAKLGVSCVDWGQRMVRKRSSNPTVLTLRSSEDKSLPLLIVC